MGKKSPRRRLVSALQELAEHMATGRHDEARVLIDRLRALASEAQSEIGRRINLVLDVHEQRLANPQSVRPVKTKNVAVEPAPNRKCQRCGTPFHAHDGDTKCGICRPADRVSVRTISAGLPGFGKRR